MMLSWRSILIRKMLFITSCLAVTSIFAQDEPKVLESDAFFEFNTSFHPLPDQESHSTADLILDDLSLAHSKIFQPTFKKTTQAELDGSAASRLNLPNKYFSKQKPMM